MTTIKFNIQSGPIEQPYFSTTPGLSAEQVEEKGKNLSHTFLKVLFSFDLHCLHLNFQIREVDIS